MSLLLKIFYGKGIFVNKFTCIVINHDVIVIVMGILQKILKYILQSIYFKECREINSFK
jgi:hypothetical protein